MEMCLHLQLLLFLGIVLRNIPQVFALEQVFCNKTQFLNEDLNTCCARCQSGFYRRETCTLSTETLCLPCKEGTFTSNWNYQPRCKPCYPCGLSLVEKEPCSSTHDTVCGCPEGQSCAMYDGVGTCRLCEPSLSLDPTTPGPAESPPGPAESPPGPTESPPDMKYIWIILGVALFLLTIILVVICIKTSLLKRFGRMIKNKRSSESVPQTETAVGIQVVGSANGGPAFPLLNGRPNTMPQQEQGKALGYPIQETDASQSGVITLLCK
ncbi:tumor necrosis factor receptor superfamily member 3 [Dendrobates tinctorius]|uniref:tumor necrosis factor receptor superfamily member 3 n=1 Tax=Dendrobates tinctorius TaxID=92724 RepID=UPI003CC9BC0E